MTCQRRDYIGADNAGLDALLLQRGGADGEEGWKGTGIDFRTTKSPHVVKDLYGVLEWVEKRNKMHKAYLGVCWGAPLRIECVLTGCSLIENYQAYTMSTSRCPVDKSRDFRFISSGYDSLWVFPRNVFDALAHL